MTLGDVTDNFDRNRAPIKSSDRRAGRTPYYGASGVIDWVEGHTHDGEYLLVAEDGENLRSRSTPIAFMAYGRFWANNHVHVIRANSLADTRFLGLALGGSEISGYLTGSTLPKLTRRALDSIVLNLPALEVQRAIAEVLGALDDKIAANASLLKLVDRLTRALFHDCVAGGYEQALSFDEVSLIGGGGTPSTKDARFWDGSIAWATPTDVTGLAGPYLFETGRKITAAGLEACASSLYPAGSILMTSRATIGAFAVAQASTAVNQGFIVVQPRAEYMRWWLFHDMLDRVDEFKAVANGATFPELSRGRFRTMLVRLGPERAVQEFAERAGALHAVGARAVAESRTLATLRDTLLPPLMSGKLRVRDAEKQVEEAV